MFSSFSPLQGLHSFVLPNGLPVYLKTDPSALLVSVQAWVRVGSIDETPREAGLAHVLEHMLFKGSKRYSATELSRLVEAHGGGMNAETSKEYTHYYIDLPAEGLEKALTAMAEILIHSEIPEVEWVREKPVILEEMKRRHDDAETLLWDELNSILYREPAHARPVIGSEETVSGLTRQDLVEFHARHYTTGQTVLAITGNLTIKKVEAMVSKLFKAMPRKERPMRSYPAPLRPAELGDPIVRRRPVHQTYLAVAFPTPSGEHPDQEKLDLLSIILGEGQRARLVEALREKKRLVTGIHALHFTQQSPGFFGVFAECEPRRKASVLQAISQELKRLSRVPITTAEMSRAKNILWNAWLVGYETPHQQASVLGHYALDRQLDRFASYFERMESITARSMRELVDAYLRQSKFQIVSVEPEAA